MSTPQMPNIPGAAVMTDTLDFVKSLWGSMGVPGLTSPTLSLDELDKKINDLKAVEAWLNLNGTMLRSSIQALEVQRGTIATLKSMGQSLADTMQQKPGRPEKSMFDANPYAAAFFNHLDPAKAAPRQPPTPVPTPPRPEAKPQPKPAAAAESRPAEEAPPKPDLAAAAAAQMANPAIWWNMLQEQFKQAVSTAMTAEAKPPTGAAQPQAPAAASDDGNAAGANTGAETEQEAKPDGAATARKPSVRKTAPKKE